MTAQPPIGRDSVGSALFWTAFAVWALHTPGRRFRSQTKGERRQDRGTRNFLLMIIGVGVTMAFVAAYWVEGSAFPGPWQIPLGIGLVLMASGLSLAEWAARTLGRFYRTIVAIQEGHRVVTDGPYRFIRHPIYAGGILTLVGIGTSLGNWVSVALCLAAALLGYQRRIRVEEHVLEQGLGEPYLEYERHTKRLVQGIW